MLNSVFITSSADLSQCPKPDFPEYAFLGRSNVGKSSLINMLTGSGNLARTSSSPGKTRLINHFLINGEWFLVDLPGYGFARISKQSREQWMRILESYLLKRENLMTTFILVDSRLPLQENDRLTINWFGERQLPFVIVFTKTDKLSAVKIDQNLRNFTRSLSDEWEVIPRIFLTSSVNRKGREDILSYITETNGFFQPSR